MFVTLFWSKNDKTLFIILSLFITFNAFADGAKLSEYKKS